MKIFDLREQRRSESKINLDNYNRLVRAVTMLQRLTFDSRHFEEQSDPSGTRISFRAQTVTYPWDKVAFGYNLAGSTATIYAGAFRIHGSGIYDVAETDVTLSGATDWVYAAHKWDHSASSISHSSTEPESTTVELRWPLYKFTASGGTYSLDTIRHMGDINIAVPLR